MCHMDAKGAEHHQPTFINVPAVSLQTRDQSRLRAAVLLINRHIDKKESSKTICYRARVFVDMENFSVGKPISALRMKQSNKGSFTYDVSKFSEIFTPLPPFRHHSSS